MNGDPATLMLIDELTKRVFNLEKQLSDLEDVKLASSFKEQMATLESAVIIRVSALERVNVVDAPLTERIATFANDICRFKIWFLTRIRG